MGQAAGSEHGDFRVFLPAFDRFHQCTPKLQAATDARQIMRNARVQEKRNARRRRIHHDAPIQESECVWDSVLMAVYFRQFRRFRDVEFLVNERIHEMQSETTLASVNSTTGR